FSIAIRIELLELCGPGGSDSQELGPRNEAVAIGIGLVEGGVTAFFFSAFPFSALSFSPGGLGIRAAFAFGLRELGARTRFRPCGLGGATLALAALALRRFGVAGCDQIALCERLHGKYGTAEQYASSQGGAEQADLGFAGCGIARHRLLHSCTRMCVVDAT